MNTNHKIISPNDHIESSQPSDFARVKSIVFQGIDETNIDLILKFFMQNISSIEPKIVEQIMKFGFSTLEFDSIDEMLHDSILIFLKDIFEKLFNLPDSIPLFKSILPIIVNYIIAIILRDPNRDSFDLTTSALQLLVTIVEKDTTISDYIYEKGIPLYCIEIVIYCLEILNETTEEEEDPSIKYLIEAVVKFLSYQVLGSTNYIPKYSLVSIENIPSHYFEQPGSQLPPELNPEFPFEQLSLQQMHDKKRFIPLSACSPELLSRFQISENTPLVMCMEGPENFDEFEMIIIKMANEIMNLNDPLFAFDLIFYSANSLSSKNLSMFYTPQILFKLSEALESSDPFSALLFLGILLLKGQYQFLDQIHPEPNVLIEKVSALISSLDSSPIKFLEERNQLLNQLTLSISCYFSGILRAPQNYDPLKLAIIDPNVYQFFTHLDSMERKTKIKFIHMICLMITSQIPPLIDFATGIFMEHLYEIESLIQGPYKSSKDDLKTQLLYSFSIIGESIEKKSAETLLAFKKAIPETLITTLNKIFEEDTDNYCRKAAKHILRILGEF